MSDLRQFAAELIANPLVPVPPMEGVAARARRYQAARRRRQYGAGLCLVALTMMAVARAGVGVGDRHSVRMVGKPGSEQGPATPPTAVPSLGGDSTFPVLPWSGRSFDGDWGTMPHKHNCPVVRRGAASLQVLVEDPSLGTPGIEAVGDVFRWINENDGICGRPLELVHGNVRTARLENFVAVLGMPLDDDLDTAIANGRIAEAGIPVVAGDSLSEIQHRSPLVYPVGPSAAAMTRIATAHAEAKGAKSFAIVYDAKQTFGQEAAESFERFMSTRRATPKVAIPILDATAGTYAPETARMAGACGGEGCDFVLLALLPETAKDWLKSNPVKPRVQLAGLSTVLTDDFTDHCVGTRSTMCDGLVAWSGYVPRTPAQPWNVEADYAYGPRHGSAMREGAVIAARVLYQGLLLAGPDATQASLRQALDSMTFRSYVTSALSWPRAEPPAQAWVLRSVGLAPDAAPPPPPPTNPGTANGEAGRYMANYAHPDHAPQWYPAGTGWVKDPG